MRIEIINQASGIDFKSCYQNRKTILVDEIEISIIAVDDLLKNKKTAGREKDCADLRNLEGVLKKQKNKEI